jgi:hypothetical protein
VHVLEESGTTLSLPEGVLVVGDGKSLSGREDGITRPGDLVGFATGVLGIAVPSSMAVGGALLVGHASRPAFVIEVR